jgi:hypothetical protein
MFTVGSCFHVRGHYRLTRPPKRSLDGAPTGPRGFSAPSGNFPGLIFLFLFCFSGATLAAGPAHGLWVWKSSGVLDSPRGAETLVDFCRASRITEVYVSVSERSATAEETQLTHLVALLHHSGIRAEALLSSVDADLPGKHRESLLRHVDGIVRFNSRREHGDERFDGIHLDVEPQQRPENKGAGNLRFLPGLSEVLRAVSTAASAAGMTVNADIQSKLLKGDLGQRKMLLTAVPRVTLMMYELSSPGDGESAQQKAEKVAASSKKFLEMAYDGLGDAGLAKMGIALRTADYGELLPEMLRKLDDENHGNSHYLGWAWHAYGDPVKAAK